MNTLDVHEAAALAKCHPDTIRKMMKAGRFPGTKVGRAWRVTEQAFEEFLLIGPVKFWRNARRNKARAARGPSASQQASWMAHRARKLKRYVSWADREAMKAIYAEAQRLTRETGIPHEVDHMLPLCGRIVSGLHVENNLQVLPKYLNRMKGNRCHE
jgi:excisionase family DNA binding protein